MPRFAVTFATNRRILPRAAAILLFAAALMPLSPEASFAHGSDDPASTATDAAADSATDQAASTAAEQAAEAASEQAAESASEQASGDAADQAAETAGDQAASDAAEQAAEDSSGGTSSSDGGSGDDRMGAAGGSTINTEKAANTAAIEIEQDLDGNEFRAHEIVALIDRDDEDAIRKAGLKIVDETPLDSLGGQLLRIRVPDAGNTADALHAIENAAPDAVAAANHVYRTADGPAASRAALEPMHAIGGSVIAGTYEGLAGIIDTPVERTYPGLGTAVAEARSFANGPSADPAHGTAVADIIARQNVRMLSANVFAKDAAGANAATTAAILSGLNWLVSRGVTVVNMSIEGPLDAALGEAIRRAQARGCIIVAAAGNRGPAAPPVYPAAFPAVVAVTAIDKQDHVYRYANQGPYILFAALGVDVDTALPPDKKQKSSGTSFAAPIVAAMIARLDRKATADSAQETLALLATRARHLGPPGRNPVFGLGALDGATPAYLGE